MLWSIVSGRTCVGLVLMALLADCEAPPEPFEPPDRLAATTAMLAPGPDAGITLVPIRGLPPEPARALGEDIATRLQQDEIAISTHTANSQSYVLQGDVVTRMVDESRAQLDFTWRLIDPSGLVGGTITQSETAPALALPANDPKVLTAIADRAAARIESLIRPPTTTARAASAAPPAPTARVVIEPVEGAPGDGRTSLTRAIRDVLLRNNVTIVDHEDAGTLLALGTVRLQNRGPVQLVQIEWRVVKPDGTSLGTVSQQNQVPTGLLDGPWGPIASAAASGSAEGILQILRSAGAGS